MRLFERYILRLFEVKILINENIFINLGCIMWIEFFVLRFKGEMSVEEVINLRRSVRKYKDVLLIFE